MTSTASSLAIDLPPTSGAARFTFIDGLRGIAALMVVVLHLLGSEHAPVYPLLHPYVPRFITFVLDHGWLGVEIFFVLSGFVIAYSQRGARITLSYLGNFALRRSLRLDPPFWVAIALCLVLNAISNRALHNHVVYTPIEVVANMFYVNHIFHMRGIIDASWTLCLEVQFYLLLTILAGIVQNLPGSRRRFLGWPSAGAMIVFLGFECLSLWHRHDAFPDPFPFPAWFVQNWHMFFLGVVIWWTIAGEVAPAWLWLMLAIEATGLFSHPRNEAMITVAAVGTLIYFVARADHLRDWLNFRWLQFAGLISYSLYLVHVPIGVGAQKIGLRFAHDSAAGAALVLVASFAVSVLAAYLLYLWVERPGVALGKRFKHRTHKPLAAESSVSAESPAPPAPPLATDA